MVPERREPRIKGILCGKRVARRAVEIFEPFKRAIMNRLRQVVDRVNDQAARRDAG